VSYTTQRPNVSREAEISALRRAINVERKAHYADLQGKRTTFSRFMRQTSEKLARRFPMELVWATVRGLFRDYPNLDVGTRISVVKRAEELLEPLWNDSPGKPTNAEILKHEMPASPFGRTTGYIQGNGPRDASSSGRSTSAPFAGDGADGIFRGVPRAVAEGHEREDGQGQKVQRRIEEPFRASATAASVDSLSAGELAVTGKSAGTTKSSGFAQSQKPSKSSTPNLTQGAGEALGGATKSSGASKTSAAGKAVVSNVSPGANKVSGKSSAYSGAESSSPKSTSGKSSGSVGQNQRSIKSSAASSGGATPANAAEQDFSSIDVIPVRYVKGIGPKAEAILNRMNIHTVSDLLKHYPRRHLDFQNRLFIRQLKPGMEVTVFGTIRSIGAFQSKRGNVSILNIAINDETGTILVTRFVGGKSNKFLLERYKSQYPKGSQVLASGVVERDSFSQRLCLKNAELEILAQGGEVDVQYAEEHPDDSTHLHTGRLVPVYPLTEGLSLRHLRNIIFHALQAYGHLIPDALPSEHRERLQLLPALDAFKFIHFPTDVETNEAARRRLVFDELFAIQLYLAKRRHNFESTDNALTLQDSENGLLADLVKSLPYTLTGAQTRVVGEIKKDRAAPKPMHRLVQGDVGSGKTIVALMAFMVAVDNGFQGAMMAPTEILAEQHYRQFQKLLTPLGLKTCLVLGKQGQKERRAVRQDLASGQVHIAVGTHALITDDVEFKNLGLIIIDEQHRFGVRQRAALKLKSEYPELLTMTATPIPRTMALTIHGDLDVSEIDEMPPGRKPIETFLFRQSNRKQINAAIEEQILRGRQVYIVFPLIDESETLSAKAATQEYERLRHEDFQHRRLGLMHGKLSSPEKEDVMEKFRTHEFDILVCTTVVEVGVDVPNATVMVIENADRFGLAQLHQLRGRVGRSSEQSYCYLVSDSQGEATLNRLNIMTATNDGFVIAEKDLEIRGPGEFLGYKQSGLPDLVLTDLVKDAKVLEDARNTAISIIKLDPTLEGYPSLLRLLKSMQKSVEAEIIRSG
jgi:ATP-dependent DNA helicase RecG